MDIVFDKWLAKESSETPFERYADDIVIHCKNIKESLRLLEKIKKRLKDCKLELNQEKIKNCLLSKQSKTATTFQGKVSKV